MGLFGGMGGPFARKTNAPAYPGQDVPTQDVPEYQPPNTLHRVLGGIGDALSTWGGGQATFIPQLMQRQQMQQQEQMYQRRAADAAKQWQAEQQWKIDHPAPINNDTVNDYNFLDEKLGPDAATQYLKNYAAGQPIVVRNPDGTITPISRAEFASPPAPATAPPGVTFTPLPPQGGASRPGSRTFP